jgi:hypothetical protein
LCLAKICGSRHAIEPAGQQPGLLEVDCLWRLLGAGWRTETLHPHLATRSGQSNQQRAGRLCPAGIGCDQLRRPDSGQCCPPGKGKSPRGSKPDPQTREASGARFHNDPITSGPGATVRLQKRCDRWNQGFGMPLQHRNMGAGQQLAVFQQRQGKVVTGSDHQCSPVQSDRRGHRT